MEPTVPADLQQQHRDELLGNRTVAFGALPQVPGERTVQSAQHRGEFGLVVDGLAEAAEDRGSRTDGGETVAADIAHDDPYTVFRGDGLVQVAADGGAPVGGHLGRGHGEPVDERGQRPQHRALGGARDLAGISELPQQGTPHMDDQSGAHREEHGAAGDPRAQAVLLRERAAQLVRDRDGAPHRGQPERQHTARLPVTSADREASGTPDTRYRSPQAHHADGPPTRPCTRNRTDLERPVRFCRPHGPKGPDRRGNSPYRVR